MKIDSVTPGTTGPVGEGRRTSRANSAGSATTSGVARGTGDEVNINPLSAQLRGAEEVLEKVPVIDSAKVEEIKAAIREGRFKVNTDLIADALLASAKELVLSQKD